MADIPSQNTLRSQTKAKSPKKTDLDVAMQAAMRLQPHEREAMARHLLGTEPHHGDGVDNDVVARNRAGLKDYPKNNTGKMPKLKQDIVKMFGEDDTLTDEFKEAAADLWVEHLQNATLRDALEAIYRLDPQLYSLMFLDENTEARIEYYASKIDQLEAGIHKQLQERNYWLRQRRSTGLHEDVIHERPHRQRRSLSEDDFRNDEDFVADEQPKQKSGRIDLYESTLKRSIQTADYKSSPVSALTEAWELKNK
jgi:hypothetical protein